MSESRNIIILTVVVLVLFGISLALNVRNGRDTSAIPQAAWIDGLKNVFLKNERMDCGDIKSGCLQDNAFVIEPGKSCGAKILESAKPVRKLSVYLTEGAACVINFSPEPDDTAVSVKNLSLISGKTVELIIMKKGGTLTITCQDSGNVKACRIALK